MSCFFQTPPKNSQNFSTCLSTLFQSLTKLFFSNLSKHIEKPLPSQTGLWVFKILLTQITRKQKSSKNSSKNYLPPQKNQKKNRFNLLNCLLSPTSSFSKEKNKKQKINPSTFQRIIPLSSPLLSCPLLLFHNFCKNVSKRNESLKPCSSCCLRYVFSPCNTRLVLWSPLHQRSLFYASLSPKITSPCLCACVRACVCVCVRACSSLSLFLSESMSHQSAQDFAEPGKNNKRKLHSRKIWSTLKNLRQWAAATNTSRVGCPATLFPFTPMDIFTQPKIRQNAQQKLVFFFFFFFFFFCWCCFFCWWVVVRLLVLLQTWASIANLFFASKICTSFFGCSQTTQPNPNQNKPKTKTKTKQLSPNSCPQAE